MTNTDGEVARSKISAGEEIGGLLYLPAIGVILSVLGNARNFMGLIEGTQDTSWDVIWGQGLITIYLLLEFVIQIYMLSFSTVLLFLFFGKRKIFTKMFIIYIVSIFALGVTSSIIAISIPDISQQLFADI